MKNVVLTRIDDRLLHGQVVVSWIPFVNANEVIVLDEDNAKDEFMKELILLSSPHDVKTHVFTNEEAVEYLKGPSNGEKIIILVKEISNIKNLLDNNINVGTINLGGLGFNNNRKRFLNFISLSNEEVELLKELENTYNYNLEVQMIPSEKKYDLEELLKV